MNAVFLLSTVIALNLLYLASLILDLIFGEDKSYKPFLRVLYVFVSSAVLAGFGSFLFE